MNRVRKRLDNEGMKTRLILQVHDELLVECPEAEAETVRRLLVEEMENAVRYSVPLEVDANVGRSWSDAK